MVDESIVAAKLAELNRLIDRVREVTPPTSEVFLADQTAQELVAFNLQLAVQTCIDIAAHVVSDEGWGVPDKAGDVFGLLATHGVISTASDGAMRGAVGLRNLIAHRYAVIDLARLFEAAVRHLGDLEGFGGQVATWTIGSD